MQTKNELISVIVPIFKNESDLPQCIESLLNQSYENIEIILVDDGSPDRCPEICDFYAEKDNRIKVIHKENGGLVSARKTGLLAATGEYIGYVDGDDWVKEDFYYEMMRAASIHNSDIVAAGYTRDIEDVSEIILNNVPLGVYEGDDLRKLYECMICAGDFFYFGIYSYVWNKIFKKTILFDAQMSVNEKVFVGEDVLCVFSALTCAKSVVVVDNVSYHYRQRSGSILKTLDNQGLEDQRIDILGKEIDEFLFNSQYSEVLRPQFERYMIGIRMIRTFYHKDKIEQCWYPFGDISKEDAVAIYSAGTFGQNLLKRLYSQKVRFAGIFDVDYKQYKIQGLDVSDPKEINCVQFDKIIIASLDERFIQKARKELYELGIDDKNIVSL